MWWALSVLKVLVNSNENGDTWKLSFQMPTVSQFWMKTEMMMIGNARSDLELLIWEITNKTDTILNQSSHVSIKARGKSHYWADSSWLSCKHAPSCWDSSSCLICRPLIGQDGSYDLNSGIWLASWLGDRDRVEDTLPQIPDLWVMCLGGSLAKREKMGRH